MHSANPQRRNTHGWIKIGVVSLTLLIIPLLLLLLSWVLPARADTPKHYTELSFSAPPAVQVPKYSRFRLANGMVVYLMEDHELPLVSGTALIRTGDRLEPSAKTGLAGITATVMRSGGSQTHPADTLNQYLEQRAASIELGMADASGSAGFSALAEDLEPVFTRFADLLRSPAFPDDKLTLAKTQQSGAISRRNDNPNAISSREFEKLIYGADSPYARQVEYATLDQIARADLVAFYQQYYRPDRILLGIVGDFDSAQMRRWVTDKLGDWQPVRPVAGRVLAGQPPAKDVLPAVNQAKPGGVFLVDQPQLTQSSVQIGHLGGQLNDPDYGALSVMNGVLNGFGGRLFNQVRSRQGLAYSVYASWRPNFDYPGLFLAGGQTRSDATVPFVQSILAEIEKIRSAPVSTEELAFAKDTVLNSFIFNFQDPAQTLSRLLRYEYFGYPQDFIFQYRDAIAKTTVADVQRVAQTHLKPESLVTLVVGSNAKIQPSLGQLGQSVQAIDITIPPPPRS
jgi:zinc protease